MEEDLKYLEDLLPLARMLLTTSQKATIQEREIQAIENLIARNKELQEERDSLMWQRNTIYIPKIEELEEKNKKHKEHISNINKKNSNRKMQLKLLQQHRLKKYIMSNYIEKSKVREKIEEYKWAIEGYDSDTADYGQSQAIGAYIALIELLKEGDTNETKM